MAYIDDLRIRIIEKINDLKEKIENNEPCPEQDQNENMLSEIDDNLEICLNNWYY